MRSNRLLGLALALATVNTAYLTWRYLAVRHGWSPLGTGLCSWTAWIDCDRVLQSAEARFFFVPNAVLGLGFFGGCGWFWLGASGATGTRRELAVRWLANGLAVGALASLWFLYLMTRLDALCPLCPWNHLLAFLAAWAARRATLRPEHAQIGVAHDARITTPIESGADRAALRRLVVRSVAFGLAAVAAWWFGSGR